MSDIIGPIRFHPNQRGREFRGEDRNFDVSSLVSVVNGGSVQERVKNGDLVGFYGHWPRIKFGLNPAEGGIVNGKAVAIEPAIRVREIKAEPDGWIEYFVEFLKTAPGKLAKRLYDSKAGGFSSAIDAPKRGSKRFVQDFFGFDFVLEPNMTANRGYVLDSVTADEAAVLDEVAHYNAALDSLNNMLDSMQRDYEMALQTINKQAEEMIELQSMLVRKNKTADMNLDSVATYVTVRRDAGRLAKAEVFLDCIDSLPSLDEPKPEKPEKPAPKTAADRFISMRHGR